MGSHPYVPDNCNGCGATGPVFFWNEGAGSFWFCEKCHATHSKEWEDFMDNDDMPSRGEILGLRKERDLLRQALADIYLVYEDTGENEWEALERIGVICQRVLK